MNSRKYFLMLDLKDDEKLIADYEKYHENVWPEVLNSIKEAGIKKMQIYRWQNRLVLMMEVDENFTLERKKIMDMANPAVMKWEKLMSKFQKSLPGAPLDEKWQLMEKIFDYS